MEFIKKNWKVILMGLIALFNGVVGFLSLIGQTIHYSIIIIANFCLSIIYPIVEVIERINQKPEIVTAKIPVKTERDIKIVREKLEVIEQEIKTEKLKVKEKKKENRIIVDLINNNVISLRTLDNNIIDKKFISALCYQAGFNVRSGLISQKIRDKINKNLERKRGGKGIKDPIEINREYPKIFNELGFIRLAGSNPFFIIPQDNIYPKKLREIDEISDYLIKKGSIVVSEEWEKLKEVYKKHDIDFYNEMKNSENPVNFNILIMKINRRDMRQRFILRSDFNKEFNSELSAIINLSKFKTTEQEKISILKLISESSLKILILSLDKSIRDKILELEEEFVKPEQEGGLDIKKFYDYHYKNIEDIKKILRTKFRKEEKIKEYAELIQNNSKDYKQDLMELGINL